MDALFFHPKVVHLPVALAVLMPLVAGGLWLAWWRKALPPRAFAVAVLLQGALVLSGVLALKSGEREEERVERAVPGRLIEQHEEAAQIFVGAGGIVLVIMSAGLFAAKKRGGVPLAGLASLGTLVVLGLGYRTGQAGGELVYRHGAANAYVQGASPTPGEGEAGPSREQDDD